MESIIYRFSFFLWIEIISEVTGGNQPKEKISYQKFLEMLWKAYANMSQKRARKAKWSVPANDWLRKISVFSPKHAHAHFWKAFIPML
jgi:hypothetical protein